ncbi:hypothetical protein GQ53DRAFT_818730 [Thozetella sp. PMI_491]|nr:hypothetical protein GQ53DRAFT_818730 [Thozetella sp. PMI_491]
MRFGTVLSGLCFALGGAIAEDIQDGCPKNEVACLDIINSSQCIEQLVIEKLSPLTKASMIKCVEYNGTASKLPGATKLCRCAGCHTAPINAAIAEMFPPPCV